MWNLENGTDEPICRAGIEMQVSRRDMWTSQGEAGGMNREMRTDIYTLPCVKDEASGNLGKAQGASGNLGKAQGAQLSALWWHRWVGWESGREVPEGGDIQIHIAGSLRCTAETQHCKATIPQYFKKKMCITVTSKERYLSIRISGMWLGVTGCKALQWKEGI